MMHFHEEQTNDEIEEVRELLYNIIKDFPTGITSTFLEKQYDERYVQKGLAKQLPSNWLNLIRHAEEFQVRDVSTYTLLYLASTNILHQTEWNFDTNEKITSGIRNVSCLNADFNGNTIKTCQPLQQPFIVDNLDSAIIEPGAGKTTELTAELFSPIVDFTINDFETLILSSLPSKGPLQIRIVSALDPDNIYFRLIAWDTYCEYLYDALTRLPPGFNENMRLEPGQILAANIDGIWERVALIRKSTANSNYWIVHAVDCGYIYAVNKLLFRPLTEAVIAFKKVFLAICKLDGIQNRADNTKQSEPRNHLSRVYWPPETQHYISEALQPTTLRNKRVELMLSGEWQLSENKKQVPICTGKLLIEGTDFGEQLVSMGLAQKK